MFVFQQAAHPPGRGGAGPPRLEHVEVSVRSGEPVQSSLNFVEDLKFRLDVLIKPPCFPILYVFFRSSSIPTQPLLEWLQTLRWSRWARP